MKKIPDHMPQDLHVPMGLSWTKKNGWLVRKAIYGDKKEYRFAQDYEAALKFRNELYAEKDAKRIALARKPVNSMYEKLSLRGIEHMKIEQVREKIAYYLERLEILYNKETELFLADCPPDDF